MTGALNQQARPFGRACDWLCKDLQDQLVAGEFPATGKLTGKKQKMGLIGPIPVFRNAVLTGIFELGKAEFPMQPNREFFWRNREAIREFQEGAGTRVITSPGATDAGLRRIKMAMPGPLRPGRIRGCPPRRSGPPARRPGMGPPAAPWRGPWPPEAPGRSTRGRCPIPGAGYPKRM